MPLARPRDVRERGPLVKRNPQFSPEIVEAIVNSLPAPRSQACLRLLPRILSEWSNTDLKRHLSWESGATIRERDQSLELVRRCALKLSKALGGIDELGQIKIVFEMLRVEGRRTENVSRSEWSSLRQRLRDENNFLAKLAAIDPKEGRKPARGRPRNVIAYLVLQDAADLFEWFTGKKAARGVDRIDGGETGPFHRFVSALWPIILGKGTEGLSAAMKNWAYWRSKFGERSALIVNIAMRHPTWGIFDR